MKLECAAHGAVRASDAGKQQATKNAARAGVCSFAMLRAGTRMWQQRSAVTPN